MNESNNNFILLGGMADFSRADGDSLLDTKSGDSVIWTAHKNMKPGDRAFFYITAPVSSIVASGKVLEKPWINEETDSRWSNYLMAEIEIKNHLAENVRIRMKTLRKLFTEWKWLAYPRANCMVPETVLEPFLELYRQRTVLIGSGDFNPQK